MVNAMDDSFLNITNALKAGGYWDNLLIIFTSDVSERNNRKCMLKTLLDFSKLTQIYINISKHQMARF